MTPFSEAQTQLKPSLWQRLAAHRALLVFGLCILAGLIWVAWRAKVRLETARATARTEARACGASLELQLSQIPGAAEALGTMARQGREGLGDFKWLQEVLSRAQLGELSRQGYDFALFIPPPAQQKPVVIVSRGLSSLQDTVQQPIRVKNLELRLALKPQKGWINKSKIALESLAVLLISALVALLVNLLESRRAMEAELKEASQRLAREAAERTQIQAECIADKERVTAAKTELRQIQAALQQAESKATQLHAQLDAMVRTRNETAEIHKAELTRAQAALRESQESAAQLRASLNAAAEAEKEAAFVAKERLQRDQAAMAELQVRLETITNSARETADTNAVKLAQLERGNRELQERLLVADQAQDRVTELAGLLQRAEEELSRREEAPPLNVLAASVEPVAATSRETAGDDPWRDLPVESSEDPNSAPALSAREPVIAPVDEPIAGADPSDEARQELTEPPASANGNPPASDEANAGASMETVEPPAQDASPSEPSPVRKAPKPGRRRQTRRDDQLALFGSEDPGPSPVDPELAEAATPPAPVIISAEEIPTPVSIVEPLDTPVIESPAADEDQPSAGEDPENHLNALRQFAEDHAHAPEQIRDALLQGDVTAAQQIVQALQVASDKIGATAVHQAAAALGRACHEHTDPGEIELVWSDLERGVRELVATFKPVSLPKEAKPAPPRRLPPAPAVDPAQLRKAVNLILPLLAERDPGAKDCLKDNRTTFRSTFTPEGYVEFEQLVKSGEFDPALEQLKKAVKKHGISL